MQIAESEDSDSFLSSFLMPVAFGSIPLELLPCNPCAARQTHRAHSSVNVVRVFAGPPLFTKSTSFQFGSTFKGFIPSRPFTVTQMSGVNAFAPLLSYRAPLRRYMSISRSRIAFDIVTAEPKILEYGSVEPLPQQNIRRHCVMRSSVSAVWISRRSQDARMLQPLLSRLAGCPAPRLRQLRWKLSSRRAIYSLTLPDDLFAGYAPELRTLTFDGHMDTLTHGHRRISSLHDREGTQYLQRRDAHCRVSRANLSANARH